MLHPHSFDPFIFLRAINFVVILLSCLKSFPPFLKNWRKAKGIVGGSGVCQEITTFVLGSSWMLLFTTCLWARMAEDDVNQSQTCCHHSSQKGRCTTHVYIVCRVWHQPQPPPPSSWGNSKLAVALLQTPGRVKCHLGEPLTLFLTLI